MEPYALIIALITILISLITLMIQGRQWKVALQTDHLFKLTDKFYSPEMRKVRQLAAEKLITNQTSDFEEIYQLLDFFIIIGSLIKRNALSIQLTYTMFEYWIVRYWYVVEPHVKALRIEHKDPELCITLEKLAHDMNDYRQSRGLIPISREEAERFLKSESRIII